MITWHWRYNAMRAKEICKDGRTIKRVLRLFKQAVKDGAYRVSRRLHAVLLNMEGYCSVPNASLQ